MNRVQFSPTGVSHATIERAGQFAEAVDTLATNVGEEVKQQVLAGDSKLTKEAVIVIAQEALELWPCKFPALSLGGLEGT